MTAERWRPRAPRLAAAFDGHDLHLVAQVRRTLGESLDHPFHAAGARPVVLREMKNAHGKSRQVHHDLRSKSTTSSPWSWPRAGRDWCCARPRDLSRLRGPLRTWQASRPRRPRRHRRRRRARSLGAGRPGGAAADQLGRRRRRPHRPGAHPGQRAAGGESVLARRHRARPADGLSPGARADRRGAVEQRRRRHRARGAPAPDPVRAAHAREPARQTEHAGPAPPQSRARRRGGGHLGQRARRTPGTARATRRCPTARSPSSGHRCPSPWTARPTPGSRSGSSAG